MTTFRPLVVYDNADPSQAAHHASVILRSLLPDIIATRATELAIYYKLHFSEIDLDIREGPAT